MSIKKEHPIVELFTFDKIDSAGEWHWDLPDDTLTQRQPEHRPIVKEPVLLYTNSERD